MIESAPINNCKSKLFISVDQAFIMKVIIVLACFLQLSSAIKAWNCDFNTPNVKEMYKLDFKDDYCDENTDALQKQTCEDKRILRRRYFRDNQVSFVKKLFGPGYQTLVSGDTFVAIKCLEQEVSYRHIPEDTYGKG